MQHSWSEIASISGFGLALMNNAFTLDYERVFRVMNECSVKFLLIGGLNYYLVHRPVSTQDIDLFISDNVENRRRCELALEELGAQWGRNDEDWGPVEQKMPGWLSYQGVYCLLTIAGPVDIFRSVAGVASFDRALVDSKELIVGSKTVVRLIGTKDLLACQMAIPETARRQDRVKHLREILGQ